MSAKLKLKERLLEIPSRSKAYRELHRLADDIEEDIKVVEFMLNELCNRKILVKKIQYICRNCGSTTILDDELLKELIVEDNCIECDECEDLIDTTKDKTGFVYYDIEDEEALINW